ncbi:hypothetical protein C922_02131 [Plasmodium inui San Antonio 1]|uniref:Uncharacterized protein n=1 Tax=Plasmodium inui San Antonio 1 TaxID=1237626 RepID=W7A6L7_9APIC|nr:hypothetical protein C922_02131 [Plasmodium inui San Antonio 1]EUD67425.1 hypothetical protein C922_02131 [Plasmodium inui San Antonio 1]
MKDAMDIIMLIRGIESDAEPSLLRPGIYLTSDDNVIVKDKNDYCVYGEEFDDFTNDVMYFIRNIQYRINGFYFDEEGGGRSLLFRDNKICERRTLPPCVVDLSLVVEYRFNDARNIREVPNEEYRTKHKRRNILCYYGGAVSFCSGRSVNTKKMHAVEDMECTVIGEAWNEKVSKNIVDWIMGLSEMRSASKESNASKASKAYAMVTIGDISL